MYLTINRFRVRPGHEAAFEALWTGRESKLPQLRGFVEFHLMRGESHADHTVYLSHTLWESRAAFEAWTKSDAFRSSHRGAGAHGAMYLGPPELECLESVQRIAAPGR